MIPFIQNIMNIQSIAKKRDLKNKKTKNINNRKNTIINKIKINEFNFDYDKILKKF